MAATLNSSTRARLSSLVDQLGNLNAEIAILEREAQTIKAELTAAGEPVIEGEMFRAAIVMSERTSLDAKLAIAMLESVGAKAPMKSAFVTAVRVSDKQG